MELVYLWVEEYKNIYKQGFNFSPRFDCKFDGENLTIEKKEYVNIFPDNINITAIVGENGSGKSSVLEAIVQLQSKEHNKIIGFLLFESNSNLYIIDQKGIKYDKNKLESIELSSFDKKTAFLKKSKCITLWMDALNSYTIKNSKRLQLILQINSLFYQFNQNDIENKHYELSQEINLSKILEEEYYFDSFYITLKNISVDYKDYWNEYNSNENQELLKIIDSIHPRIFEKDNFRFVIAHNYYIATIRFYLKHWHNVIDIPNCNFSSLFIEFIMNINEQLNITTEELFDLTIDFNLKIQQLVDKDADFSPSVNILVLNYAYLSIILKNLTFDYSKNESNFINSKFYKIYKLSSNKKIKKSIDSIKHFTGMEEDWSEFHFFDIDIINQENGNKYSTLSDGERQLLNISLDLIYSLKSAENYGNNQLMIFDEVDSFLHPKWSKTLIYRLKKVIENYNNLVNNEVKLHLLFSTHSPFIISDLPKENVIFLEKDEECNCENVTNETNIDTFGANIHTLLSHGFFMKDGLMGEFAKEKITEVFEYLKNDAPLKTIKEEDVESVIGLIGEEFLKQKLLNMYRAKFNIKSKDDEINELKAEIERLKNDSNSI